MWATTARLRRMVDIATVSVVSSAAVALGTLAVNFIGSERQRKHESDLDFEKRVWDQKSEALFSVMNISRILATDGDAITDANRRTYAINLSKRLDDLHTARGVVDAFASTRCAVALTLLIDAMRDGGVKHNVGYRVDRLREQSMELDPDDERWASYRDWRKQAEAKALENFDPNLADIRAKAERVFDAARESVRRSKD